MSLGEYNGAGSGTTKLLLHLNGNSNDSSGNSNNGSDTNIVYSQANGKFGQGAGFNGTSSRITKQDPTGTTALTNYTVLVWVKRGSIDTDDCMFMASNKYSSFTIGIGVSFGSDDKIYVYHQNGTDNGVISTTETFTDTTNWHLVTVSHTSSGNTVVYYDGRIVFNGSQRDPSWGGSTIANFYLNVGAVYDSKNATIWYFNGSIDEVIVENRSWTAEQVKKYYTMTKGRFGII